MTNENIVNIIKSKFKEGLDKASIEFYLLENGYNESDIEDSFNSMWDNPSKEYKNSSNKRFKYVIISSILGLLCAGIFYVFGVLEDYEAKTNDQIRKNSLEKIKIDLELYYMDNNKYPNTLNDIYTPSLTSPDYINPGEDPFTLKPYKYISTENGYKLCANLEMPKNEEICINSGI